MVLNALCSHAYRRTFVEAYKVPTGSMTPTIVRGDHLLAIKWAYGWRDPIFGRVIFGARQARRGEVIVFWYPDDRSRAFVMRCIGLPGETVEIRDKTVLIDGKAIEEPYAQFADFSEGRSSWGPTVVPANTYFVLGDNRDNSRDSRFWGHLDQNDLIGRASVLYWSWDAAASRVRWKCLGRRLE
jgi:signal peptidase I